jgi:hypothetical protein
MTAGEMLNKLSAFYSKKVSPEFVTQYNKVMQWYSPDILQRVYDHTTEHDDKFQSLSMLRNFADHFKDEADRKRHQAQKHREEEPNKTEHNSLAKSVFMTINAAMSGQITRLKFLACMEEMKMQTGELRGFYSDRGLDLNKPCGHGLWKVE